MDIHDFSTWSPAAMNFSPLNKTLQQPLRFPVMAYLIRAGGSASFTEIYRALDINPGSLTVHSRVLECAGFIKVRKSFEHRKPHTVLALTAKGRAAFAAHRARLDAMSAPVAVAS
jgi:DNA-binding MarR family transcriptional regulator